MGRAPISRVFSAPEPPDTGGTLSVAEDDGDLFPVFPFTYLVWPVQELPNPFNSERGIATGRVGDEFSLVRPPEAIEITSGLLFAVVEAIAVYRLGDDVTLSHDFRSDDPPYLLTLHSPQGEVGSYGTATGVVNDGNGEVHFSFEPEEAGYWSSHWESASVNAAVSQFFVQFDEIQGN